MFHRTKVQILRLLILGTVISLLVIGCAPRPSAETPDVPAATSVEATTATRAEIRVGVTTEAVGLDPQLSGAVSDVPVIFQIFDTLMRYDLEGNLLPHLATNVELVNETQYEITIREGVLFHNGREVKAEDVHYSLLRARDPDLSISFRFVEDIDSVEVVDDYTVRVLLKKENSQFIHALSQLQTAIVPQEEIEARGSDFSGNPVGTGPFKFSEWVKDDHITLQANDDYFLGPPMVSGVTFRTIPEPNVLVLELESGAIDVAATVPAESYDRLEQNDDLVVGSVPGLAYQYVGMQQARAGTTAAITDGPFSDLKVRLALWHAVRWDEVYQSAIPNPAYGERLACHLPPASPFHFSDCEADWPQPQYDPDKARQLLAEAGYPDGFKTSILYWQRAAEKIAVPIQADMAEVGVEVELLFQELGTLVENLFSGNYDLILLLWTGQDNPDPFGWLYAQFHTSYFGSTGNQAWYQNEEVDRLLDEAEAASGDERLALYRQVQSLLAEDIAQIPVHTVNPVMAWRKEVQGFSPDPIIAWSGGTVRIWQPPVIEVSIQE